MEQSGKISFIRTKPPIKRDSAPEEEEEEEEEEEDKCSRQKLQRQSKTDILFF